MVLKGIVFLRGLSISRTPLFRIIVDKLYPSMETLSLCPVPILMPFNLFLAILILYRPPIIEHYVLKYCLFIQNSTVK